MGVPWGCTWGVGVAGRHMGVSMCGYAHAGVVCALMYVEWMMSRGEDVWVWVLVYMLCEFPNFLPSSFVVSDLLYWW